MEMQQRAWYTCAFNSLLLVQVPDALPAMFSVTDRVLPDTSMAPTSRLFPVPVQLQNALHCARNKKTANAYAQGVAHQGAGGQVYPTLKKSNNASQSMQSCGP